MPKENKNMFNNTDRKTPQKQHGFSVPTNYFDTVEDQLFANLATSEFPKETGHQIPNNYFSTVEETIFSRLDLSKKEVKVISLRSRILSYIPTAAAASVLLFFGLNYLTLTNTTSFENISSTELENWIDESYLTLHPESFNAQFVDADFTETSLLEDELTLTDEEIFEYLNTIDNSVLLTEIE